MATLLVCEIYIIVLLDICLNQVKLMPTSTVMSLLRGNSKDEIFEVFFIVPGSKDKQGSGSKARQGSGRLMRLLMRG